MLHDESWKPISFEPRQRSQKQRDQTHFQDFPGPGNFTQKSRTFYDFPGGVGTLHTQPIRFDPQYHVCSTVTG